MDLTQFDQNGFLKEPTAWTESLANEIAMRNGINLTPQHWEVIHVVRRFYQRTRISPTMRPLVKLVKARISPELGSSIVLRQLFPTQPSREVARISGLPKPADCL